MKTIYLDTETTGLNPDHDEVLEIAIIDDQGTVLLNTLVRPVKNTEWPIAQAINGISPDMVANAPTLEELAAQIAAAFKDARAVMYNAAFDIEFLKPCLSDLCEGQDYFVHCAMRRFSVVRGVWDGRKAGKGDYKRWKQTDAAEHVGHQWSGNAHRAMADVQACRSIWQWTLQGEHSAAPNSRNLKRPWRDVFGLTSFERSLTAVEAAYRRLVADIHPMHPSGNNRLEELNAARGAARRELRA